MTSESTDLAARMVTGCAILSEQGLVEGFGHLSARLPGDRILMTPRKALALVQEEELLTLDLAGNVLAGEGRPAVESAMHLAIYRHRPDVHAIARTHSRACAVFAVTNRPVRAPFVTIFRVSEGRIVSHRSYWDLAGFLAQLGLGPK